MKKSFYAFAVVAVVLASSPYTFLLLNGDMELHRNRHLFIQKIFQKSKS